MSFQSLTQMYEQNRSSVCYKRLSALFDPDTFHEIDAFAKSSEHFAEVAAGFGYINGCPAYAFSQNSEIAGGAVGKAHAAKIKKIYDLAAKTGTPVVGIYDSHGVYLNEGNDGLAAYGEMIACSNNLSGVVPQISLVLGPCGGCASMAAAGADVVIMSREARLYLNAPDSDALADADFAARVGVAHVVADDEACAIASARDIMGYLPMNNLSEAPISDFEEPDATAFTDGDMYKNIDAIVDAGSFHELQKDFGPSAIVGFAKMTGNTVGVLATNGAVNEGKLDNSASVKLARFIRLCDAFAIPAITFVDTMGFDPGSKDAVDGAVREASKLAHAYAEATTVKLTVITGKAVGPAYIALASRAANADMVMAWPGAVISALNPEAAVAVMWPQRLKEMKDPLKDRAALVAQYCETVCSPIQAAADGVVEAVFEAKETRSNLICALDMLCGKRVSRLPKKHSNIQL